MIKAYVKVDGMWVQVVRIHGFYDLVCWGCAFATVGIVCALVWKNVL